MSPNEWGDFLAGLTAPMAFLWLIIGYMLQKQELRLSTEALGEQQVELARQVHELSKQSESMQSSVEAMNNLTTAIDNQSDAIERASFQKPL